LKQLGTDARSDLFTLSATLYHLMTGEPPVSTDVREKMMGYAMPDPMRAAHQQQTQIPFGISAVLARGLALDRERRFATAQEMRQALQQAQADIAEAALAEQRERERKEAERKEAESREREAAAEQQRQRQEQLRQQREAEQQRASLTTQLDPSQLAPTELIAPPSPSGGKLIVAAIVLAMLAALAYWVWTRQSTTSDRQAAAAPEIEMVTLPGGTFLMGSPANEADRSDDEGPQHRVTVQSFAIGKFEITQAQWRAVMGNNPSRFKGDNRPVESVSWNDAKDFCQKLSQMTSKTYRLPTEAEWEYAARAGTTTPFAFGSSLSSTQANF
jgi:formylglycine-generating enzyme required for sulfatase activity